MRRRRKAEEEEEEEEEEAGEGSSKQRTSYEAELQSPSYCIRLNLGPEKEVMKKLL